jgi:hypothetical protein
VSIAEIDRRHPTISKMSEARQRAFDAVRRDVPGANRGGLFRMSEAGSSVAKPRAGGGLFRGSAQARRGRAPIDGRRSGSWKRRPLTRAERKRSWPFGEARLGGRRRGATGSVRGRAASPERGRQRRRPGKRRFGTALLVPVGRVYPSHQLRKSVASPPEAGESASTGLSTRAETPQGVRARESGGF